ncbi:MAG: hypothetical protein Q9175_005443 [Cornicularia normoerica]
MAPPNITVIGSLNTDLITRTSRIPAAGETLISSSYATGCGGKGANQAVACARLSRNKGSEVEEAGCTVNMIGAVGDDMFGRELISGLSRNGIGVDGVKVKGGEKSGVAVIIVEEESGENRILMSPNANYALRQSDFESLPDPLPDLIILQLEVPLITVLHVLKLAREKNVEVLLNPAPAVKLPREAYSAVHHLVVNETEADIITGTTGQKHSWALWGEHVERLIDLGVRHVLITLGAQGVIYLDTKIQWVLQVSGEKVTVVDSTGAGDTFVGAYAAMLTKRGREHRERSYMMHVVAFANRAAAKTVQKGGVQSAIPWRNEVSTENMPSSVGPGIDFDEWKRGMDPASRKRVDDRVKE